MEETETSLDAFFAAYPAFDYDATQPVMQEFKRMCEYFGWGKKNTSRKEAHEALKESLVLQFNDFYGTDIHDIESWRKLCQVLRIVPIPDTITQCRKVVSKTHVNLVDLVDVYRVPGMEVQIFPTINALRRYTWEHKKIFPKERAKAGGVLKYLLRPIL